MKTKDTTRGTAHGSVGRIGLGRHRRRQLLCTTIVRPALLAAVALFPILGAAAAFRILDTAPLAPAGSYSSAAGISADGTVVVGYAAAQAYRWNEAGGMVGLGFFQSGPDEDYAYFQSSDRFSFAAGVSPDGRVVVGSSGYNNGWDSLLEEAVRWTEAEGMAGLGFSPGGGYGSEAKAASADGKVIVGWALGIRMTGEAFRWTEADGMVGLGYLPGDGYLSWGSARDVSADGGVVVGQSDFGAFRWTSGGGMVALGALPGKDGSSANGVSADGDVVVGESCDAFIHLENGQYVSRACEAFRWTSGEGMVGLGGATSATDASADGAVVVGNYVVTWNQYPVDAFVWTARTGTRRLKDVLIASGVTGLDGITLVSASSVSADGLMVVGTTSDGGSYLATLLPESMIPAPFSLVDQTGVAPSTVVTSAPVTITGLSEPAPILVTNGEYSVGCGEIYTSAAGLIGNGETVCVRHTSGWFGDYVTTTTLSVGSLAKPFTSTTATDTTPAPFTFADQSGVAPVKLMRSSPAEITGISAPTPVSVTNGEYSVGCRSTYTSAASTVSDGEIVCVRHTSAATGDTATSTTLTVGGVTDTFTTTTATDTTPRPFTLADQSGVDPVMLMTSSPVTISGISAPTPVSVTNGEYSVGCGPTYTSAASTVSDGEIVCVRHTSAATGDTSTSTTLMVGGVTDTFTTTTAFEEDSISNESDGDGGGGSFGWLELLGLGLLAARGARHEGYFMSRYARRVFALAMGLATAVPAAAGVGDPDINFGTNGQVAIAGNLGGQIAELADGRILIIDGTAINRYTAAGILDTAFGDQGRYVATLPVSALALQQDGKVLLAGGFFVARLNGDGTLDNDFGTGGVTTPSIGYTEPYYNSIVALPNGTILAPISDWGQYRLDSFSANGHFLRSAWQDISPELLALAPDGGVILTGYDPSNPRYVAIRMKPDGAVDPTFGGDGRAEFPPGTYYAWSQLLRIEPGTGRIILCGPLGVARLTSDGQLDTTFGARGDGFVPFGVSPVPALSACEGLLVTADGGIVVAGPRADSSGSRVISVVGLEADGTIDWRFGAGTGESRLTGDHAWSLVPTRDGNALLGITTQRGEPWEQATLLRLDLATSIITPTPEPFSLVDQGDVVPSAVITSAPVTITGLSESAPIRVNNGEYSVGCGATYTSAPGTVSNGEAVCVRQTSAATLFTATNTFLIVGRVSDTFTTTTVAGPAFRFADLTGVLLRRSITSAPVTFTGLSALAPVSVTNGEYSIGCGEAYTRAAGLIGNGEMVCVRHTTAATGHTSTSTTLTVGGVTDTFTTTTAAPADNGGNQGGGGGLGWLELLGLGLLAVRRWRVRLLQTVPEITGTSNTPEGNGKDFRSRCVRGVLTLLLVPGLTSAGSFTPLSFSPFGVSSSAVGVSGDGAVVVGQSFVVPDPAWGFDPAWTPFRWTGGGMTLGGLQGYTGGFASGVSADGAVVVGHLEGGNASDGFTGEAFRWTGGVMTGLGDFPGGIFYSSAGGVSADGAVVVGSSATGNGSEAFRWTGGVMTGLGFLPGNSDSGAAGVSADGAVVVGMSSNGGLTEAFRWTGGVMTGLGFLPGDTDSIAYGVSADGAVVVGQSGVDTAFVWTEATGMKRLEDVLVASGATGLAGWSLDVATGISADGQWVVGSGTNPGGDQEAFLANISPAESGGGGGALDGFSLLTLSLISLISLFGVRRRKTTDSLLPTDCTREPASEPVH